MELSYRDKIDQLILGQPPNEYINVSPFGGSASNGAVEIISTTTTLTPSGPGSTYSSTWFDLLQYNSIIVTVTVPGLIQGYTDWSDDNGATTITSTTTPFFGNGSFALGVQGRYLRVRAVNLSGSSNLFVLAVIAVRTAPQGITFPVAGIIDPSFPALLTKSQIVGQNPAGTFANVPAGGPDPDVSTSTPLTGGATYTSAWSASVGYVSIGVGIVTDQLSITNGIEVQFSDDGGVTQTTKQVRTFGAAEVSNGSAFFAIPNQGSTYRIVYHNGAVAQSVFNLATRLEVTSLQAATSPIESPLGAANSAQMIRSVLVGKGDSGTYTNVPTNDSGHLKVDVAAADASVPLKSVTSAQAGQSTNLSTGSVTQIANPALANRKAITVIADPSNNKTIFIGFVNSAGSCLFPLAPGVAWSGDVDATVGLFVAPATASNNNIMWIEVAGTP